MFNFFANSGLTSQSDGTGSNSSSLRKTCESLTNVQWTQWQDLIEQLQD